MATQTIIIDTAPTAEPITTYERIQIVDVLLGLLLGALLIVAQARLSLFAGLLVLLLAHSLTGPLLALGYAAALALLAQRPRWAARLAPLGAAGRLALTNYLAQSLICTTLFYGYGAGLFGQVGAAAGILIAIAIYALQLLWSVWWLRHFRFGPAEWLWRTLTYGRAQPMRLQPRRAAVR